MSISMLSKIVFIVALLIAPLNAQEIKDSPSCDNSYNLCIETCEESDNPSADCFSRCDDEYNKCLFSEKEDEQKDSE